MKKYNVGIVGSGWAAEAQIAAMQAGKLGQVTRVCSSGALNDEELSAKHGAPILIEREIRGLQQIGDVRRSKVYLEHLTSTR
jgi:hypothetical protein